MRTTEDYAKRAAAREIEVAAKKAEKAANFQTKRLTVTVVKGIGCQYMPFETEKAEAHAKSVDAESVKITGYKPTFAQSRKSQDAKREGN